MDKKITRSLLAAEIKKKGSVKIRVFGGSMSPVIRGGQEILVKSCKQVNIGDIVCYKTKDWFLVHRVKSIDKTSGLVTVEGDSKDRVLHKIKKHVIMGVVQESVYRKIIKTLVDKRTKIC
jgi:phage repressor protein C with HTH and peptisase S24 domain